MYRLNQLNAISRSLRSCCNRQAGVFIVTSSGRAAMSESRTPIAPFIRRFLLEHLVQERNLSHNTQSGYRDTLLLLLPFVAKVAKVSLDQLGVEDFTTERIRAFLKHLQAERHVSDTTR